MKSYNFYLIYLLNHYIIKKNNDLDNRKYKRYPSSDYIDRKSIIDNLMSLYYEINNRSLFNDKNIIIMDNMNLIYNIKIITNDHFLATTTYIDDNTYIGFVSLSYFNDNYHSDYFEITLTQINTFDLTREYCYYYI